MQADTNLTGQFLIAMPGLTEEPFFRSVCYLCQYDQQGALGLVINKPANIELGEVFLQTKITPVTDEIGAVPVYLGGPVNPGRCLVVHQPVGEWAATLQVNDEIGITGSSDVLEAIAGGEGPEDFIVCLGYAGWGPGQLDAEILRNDWLTAPADQTILFHASQGKRWEAALALIGVNPSQLSSDVGHG
ncbi:MAG: YqgE/AlgH family protein [Gammaproteobacteria bacterium]